MTKKHPKYCLIDGYMELADKGNEEVASALGISVRTYRDKINGSRDFSGSELRTLCDILKRSADELLTVK